MSMDKETTAKIARLSRIKMDSDELDVRTEQLSKILGFIEQLSEVDTNGVEPMPDVTGLTLPLRDDVVNDGGYPEKILANAPETTQGFFAVKKAVE